MKYLITAGPTREFIDDVRYISNMSSGRMGFALARAARLAGHAVAVIAGPVEQPTPEGVERIDVTSAEEMRRAVMASSRDDDIIVMCAAVADYKPAGRISGKMKKGADSITLELVKTPDILSELGRVKHNRLLIGFALEAENAVENAKAKLVAKNADAIVLNLPAAIGARDTAVQFITSSGEIEQIGPTSKEAAAVEIIKRIDRLYNAKKTSNAR